MLEGNKYYRKNKAGKRYVEQVGRLQFQYGGQNGPTVMITGQELKAVNSKVSTAAF